ncbi:MAG: hypothetical protein JHD31_02725 [Rhodoluna sp.]|jgi:hypothetical protein|nr:hypothetical protein [Rhodoluna sp.]
MEFTGTGGILLLVAAVLWLGFMTPSGKRGINDHNEARANRKASRRAPAVEVKKEAPKVLVTPWFEEQVISEVESLSKAVPAAEKAVVNRLPDPLSARLGKIESVKWAEILELEDARKEKENISSENLDDIMRRRRSNG